MKRALPIWIAAIALVAAAGGCADRGPAATAVSRIGPTGLVAPRWMASVEATVAPPVGWARRPLINNSRHTHEIWVSPTDQTAYGVMRFSLPLPVGPDLVLWGFLRAMRHKQGDATLLSSEKDPELPGIRFVAVGGKFKIRVNLTTRGWEGWAVYAATLRGQSPNRAELFLAEKAKEFTVPGQKSRVEKSSARANERASRDVLMGYDRSGSACKPAGPSRG